MTAQLVALAFQHAKRARIAVTQHVLSVIVAMQLVRIARLPAN